MHRPNPPLHPLLTTDFLILGRIVLSTTALQNTTFLIQIETEKEWHADSLPTASILCSMDGADVFIVRNPLEIIPDIDDESAVDWFRIDPLTVAIQDLKSAGTVLPEDGEQLEVGV